MRIPIETHPLPKPKTPKKLMKLPNPTLVELGTSTVFETHCKNS